MSTYYDAIEVVQRGTLLSVPMPFSFKKPFVKKNEVLVAVLHDGRQVIALDVTKDTEFDYFRNRHSEGLWQSMDVYALPKDEIPNCESIVGVRLSELETLLQEHPPKQETRLPTLGMSL